MNKEMSRSNYGNLNRAYQETYLQPHPSSVLVAQDCCTNSKDSECLKIDGPCDTGGLSEKCVCNGGHCKPNTSGGLLCECPTIKGQPSYLDPTSNCTYCLQEYDYKGVQGPVPYGEGPCVYTGKVSYYRAGPSPSGHDCFTQNPATCQNPGKSVCTFSDNPCGAEEAGCYATLNQCNQYNTCNQAAGWFKNTAGTDCNIYACTTDGSVMNRDSPALKPAANDGSTLYTFSGGKCYRKGPGLNPDDEKYCTGKDFPGFSCSRNDPTKGVNPDWGNWGCGYDGFYHCSASMSDNAPTLIGKAGAPTYMYANYDHGLPIPGSSNRVCWFDGRPWGNRINFNAVSYPAPGQESAGCA